MNLIQMRSHGLNQAIAANEKEMSVLARQPTISANTFSALGTYILASERSKLLEQRMLVEQKQMDLRMAMSALQSKPTTLIKPPPFPPRPVNPRPLLYFVFATGIGLMLVFFSALVIEFISKTRRPASS